LKRRFLASEWERSVGPEVSQNWIFKLEEDNRLVAHAAANARRALDLILGTSFENVGANEELTTEAVETAAPIVNAQCEVLAA